MKKLIKISKNNKWELKKGPKYTTLLMNDETYEKWSNEDISIVLNTSDFESQLTWFENHIK